MNIDTISKFIVSNRMKIAFTFDFEDSVNLRREGIGVYARYLVSSLLKYTNCEIEIWTYSFNKKNAYYLFEEEFSKYKNRIFMHKNKWYIKKFLTLGLKKIFLLLFFFIEFVVGSIYIIFLNKKLYSNYIQIELKKLKKYIFYIETQKLIFDAKYSKADIAYSMFRSLKLANFFKCKKIVQVHDLFTIANYDLFCRHWTGDEIIVCSGINNNVLANLSDYSKNNAFFCCSSNYIAEQHLMKYVPNLRKSQIKVISFPPLIKKFNDCNIISKVDFKRKYGLSDIYIAVPSQNRPNKNWSVIFKAIAIAKKNGIDIQFVTTGKVNDLKKDADLVKELSIENNILEIGSISDDDLYMLYKYQNIAIGSTYIEGSGLSGQVLESLSVGGVPAIHSRCLGYSDALIRYGLTEKSADLNWFDPDDYITLYKYIVDVLDDPRKHVEKQKTIMPEIMKRSWHDVVNDHLIVFSE